VTGSIATILYGEPRFTNDIDVVVQLPPEAVEAFCAAFPQGEFYLDAERILSAIARRGQFNVIHPASGLKVEVIIPAMDAFDRSRFTRVRRVHPAAGLAADFAAPEDVILKKLQYYAAGGSDKHLRDVAGVLRISGTDVDRDYVATWAERLGVLDAWHRILDAEAGGDEGSLQSFD
jgi:hypothetical protein